MTVPRAIADVVETVKAANAGQWDVIDRDRDRRAARGERWGKAWAAARAKRHRAAGGSGEFKPGARAYLDDVYTGWWADRIANRQAKREARGPVTWTPDGKPWHERVDDAVFTAGRKVRDAWQRRGGRPAPEFPAETPSRADVVGSPHPTQVPPSADSAEPPSAEPISPAPEPNSKPVDSITDEGATMTQPTVAATTEVNNNEDARIALTAVASAAAEAADALGALEAAKAKLQAAANGTLEGMSGKRFDAAATGAAAAAADAINVGDLAEWSEKFDTAEAEARSALRHLDKYLDSEDLIASNNVDASTLQTH